MTVRELIKQLGELDLDMPVLIASEVMPVDACFRVVKGGVACERDSVVFDSVENDRLKKQYEFALQMMRDALGEE